MDLTKYPIPVKIENDGLRETIVAVKFNTDYNLSKLESVVEGHLYSIPERVFEKIETREIDKEIEDSPDNGSSFFYTDNIYKVIVKKDQVAFNCVDSYTGWGKYFGFIYSCLQSLQRYITGNYVLIRYISSYPDLSLESFLDGNIKYPHLYSAIKEQVHMIKCKLLKDDGVAFGMGLIRLFDSVDFQQQIQSIIDVEIQSIDISAAGNNFDAMIEFINDGHLFEKKLFYSLLTKEFVDSKNPTYA